MSTVHCVMPRFVGEVEAVDDALVEADQLQHRGDPRGELIALQTQLERGPTRALRAREARLLHDHLHEWLGGGPPPGVTIRWRRGYVDAIEIDHSKLDTRSAGALIARIVKLPVGARLRSLVSEGDHKVDDYAEVVEALVATTPPLRELVCDFAWPYEVDLGRRGVDLGTLDPLWTALPSLEHVALKAYAVSIGIIHAPRLRHFTMLTPYGPDGAITHATWPALDTLVIGRCRGTLADLSSLLDARGVPSLRHVQLFGLYAEVLDAFATSVLLRQLETLELEWIRLSGQAAPKLDPNDPAFAHLTRFSYHG